jgi:hypothetical protein
MDPLNTRDSSRHDQDKTLGKMRAMAGQIAGIASRPKRK